MTSTDRIPLAVRLLTSAGVVESIGLALGAAYAAVVAHRAWHTSDGTTPSVDRQFTAIGWGMVTVVASGCFVVLALGTWRLRPSQRRGRILINLGQIWTFLLVVCSAQAVTGRPHAHVARHLFASIYPLIVVVVLTLTVAVLVTANVRATRGWSAQARAAR